MCNGPGSKPAETDSSIASERTAEKCGLKHLSQRSWLMQQLHATSLCSQQAACLLRNSEGSCALTCSVSLGQLYKPEQDKKAHCLSTPVDTPQQRCTPFAEATFLLNQSSFRFYQFSSICLQNTRIRLFSYRIISEEKKKKKAYFTEVLI